MRVSRLELQFALEVFEPIPEQCGLGVGVLGNIGVGNEYAQFLLGERGTYSNFVFAGSARHGFGFGAHQHDIAVSVCGSFGSLDVIPNERVLLVEELFGGRTLFEESSNGRFDFGAAGLVECDDSKRLCRMLLGVVYGCIGDSHNLVVDNG